MRRVKVEDNPNNLNQAIETATKLASALDEANGVKPKFDIAHANAPKFTPFKPGLASIVETAFLESGEKETYDRVVHWLRATEGALEAANLLKLVNQADAICFETRRLYSTFRLERDLWERKNEINFAAIRTEATRSLQEEKDKGKRSKQITDKDVDTECASIAPDQWMAQETEKLRKKHTEEVLEGLVECTLNRSKALQMMLSKSR